MMAKKLPSPVKSKTTYTVQKTGARYDAASGSHKATMETDGAGQPGRIG